MTSKKNRNLQAEVFLATMKWALQRCFFPFRFAAVSVSFQRNIAKFSLGSRVMVPSRRMRIWGMSFIVVASLWHRCCRLRDIGHTLTRAHHSRQLCTCETQPQPPANILCVTTESALQYHLSSSSTLLRMYCIYPSPPPLPLCASLHWWTFAAQCTISCLVHWRKQVACVLVLFVRHCPSTSCAHSSTYFLYRILFSTIPRTSTRSTDRHQVTHTKTTHMSLFFVPYDPSFPLPTPNFLTY